VLLKQRSNHLQGFSRASPTALSHSRSSDSTKPRRPRVRIFDFRVLEDLPDDEKLAELQRLLLVVARQSAPPTGADF
jgi:hypothetical protein